MFAPSFCFANIAWALRDDPIIDAALPAQAMFIPPFPSPPETIDLSMPADEDTAPPLSCPALPVTVFPAPKDSQAKPVVLTALPVPSVREAMRAPFIAEGSTGPRPPESACTDTEFAIWFTLSARKVLRAPESFDLAFAKKSPAARSLLPPDPVTIADDTSMLSDKISVAAPRASITRHIKMIRPEGKPMSRILSRTGSNQIWPSSPGASSVAFVTFVTFAGDGVVMSTAPTGKAAAPASLSFSIYPYSYWRGRSGSVQLDASKRKSSVTASPVLMQPGSA